MNRRDIIENDERKVPCIWKPSREDTSIAPTAVTSFYQRCNAVADLQQSLGRASAAINRVVPEQKRCQVYLYLSLVLIMSSGPNGRGHRRIAIQRLDRRIPDKHALADEILGEAAGAGE